MNIETNMHLSQYGFRIDGDGAEHLCRSITIDQCADRIPPLHMQVVWGSYAIHADIRVMHEEPSGGRNLIPVSEGYVEKDGGSRGAIFSDTFRVIPRDEGMHLYRIIINEQELGSVSITVDSRSQVN